MKLWQKIALGATALLSATVLAACGSSSSSSSSTDSNKVTGTVKLWVDTTQVPYYKKIVKNFNKKYPDVTVKVTQSPNGSANAKTDVGKDPAKAADVFEVPNDQLGSMADQALSRNQEGQGQQRGHVRQRRDLEEQALRLPVC